MTKKFAVAALVSACGMLTIGAPAYANAELAKQKNCLACHAGDKKLVGPAYREIAAKYKADKNAPAVLAKKIREGGVGVWGQIPMPANPQVNEQEAQTLAKWVLSM
ncbi:MAG TPA: c-type cytochrome [Burkholderiaceae bacterium]|nr:c-type cytochrome [Burkholderiaceae bacterium]